MPMHGIYGISTSTWVRWRSCENGWQEVRIGLFERELQDLVQQLGIMYDSLRTGVERGAAAKPGALAWTTETTDSLRTSVERGAAAKPGHR